MQLGRSPVSLADLIRSQLLQPGQELSFRRSTETNAHVTAQGTIRFDGKEYGSPSTAARAAAGGTSTNGWTAWYAKVGDAWIALAHSAWSTQERLPDDRT